MLTGISDTPLAATITYGNLIPARSSAISAGEVQFRLYSKHNSGYRVDATATFSAMATAPSNGGATIAASDIGVGITSVVASSDVLTPRTDAVLLGFDYDPSTVAATDGVTPYAGAGSGQATLADLLTGKELLHGPKIAHNTNPGRNNYLTVTLKSGIVPQYFTPCTFTSIVTLTISDGP